MWNMNDVVSIKYKGNYVYQVVFDDGRCGDIDFSDYLDKGPVFKPLQEYFCLQTSVSRSRKHFMAEWR